MSELKLAACGLDCNKCSLYLAAHDAQAAAALVEWFRSRGWIGEDEGAEAVQRKAPLLHGLLGRFCKVVVRGLPPPRLLRGKYTRKLRRLR